MCFQELGRHHVFFCLTIKHVTDVNENKFSFCVGLMHIFTDNLIGLMPLGNTNQNSKHFPHCVIQILIQDPLCTESAQCLHQLFIEFILSFSHKQTTICVCGYIQALYAMIACLTFPISETSECLPMYLFWFSLGRIHREICLKAFKTNPCYVLIYFK